MCPRRRRAEDVGVIVLIERLSQQLEPATAAVTFEHLQFALESERASSREPVPSAGLGPEALRILLRCGYQHSSGGDLVLPAGTNFIKATEVQEARDLIGSLMLSLKEEGTTASPLPPTGTLAHTATSSSPSSAVAFPAVPNAASDVEAARAMEVAAEAAATELAAAEAAAEMAAAEEAAAEAERAEPQTPPKSDGAGGVNSPGTEGSTRAPSSAASPLSDRELAEQLARELAKEDEPKVLEFARFRSERVLVDPNAVEEINRYCAERREQYVDPQFPPSAKSLYLSEHEADSWECLQCHVRTRLPPVPELPKTKEEAKRQEEHFKNTVKCEGCGAPAYYVVQVRYFSRPTQWLRPGAKCEGCEFLYSQLPTDRELCSHMCTHFLRDSLSQQTVGAPWKLIREEARPEDVCQGGLGNCWFAGALSVVACKPQLIDKLFLTKEYNPNGVYHMQLCHAGEWRGIVLDDLLPTSQVFEGYMDNTTIYYSRGGNLCYLQGARRQLWVPLVEKGAAKLYGCYGSLKGGTFGEAMGLFTGFPTERLKLYVPKAIRKARAERRHQRNTRRTEALLQGRQVAEDGSDDSDENDDLTWTRLMSSKDAGYLMGMGCTEEGCEKTKHHIVEEMGLQAPHAYGIMDLREAEVDGGIVRLLKIRNPWGERAPRTWKGAWGKDSEKWTDDLKLKLGVTNSSGVLMDDPMSIFWMDFKDAKEYFAAVEICRVHLGWQEIRKRVWLPSGAGPGEALKLTILKKTQLDIAVWQEKHQSREGAVGARSTNVDVGLAVLRQRLGGSNGNVEYELIEYIQRECGDDVSGDLILEGGYEYHLVPLCFGLMQEREARNAVIAVHSVHPVEVELVPSSWHSIACATFEAVRRRGRRWTDWSHPGLTYWLLHESGGSSFVAENTSNKDAAVQVDASESLGVIASCGCLGTVSAIPARSRQVLLVLAFSPAATYTRISILPQPVPVELAPPVSSNPDDMHMALPLLPTEWRSSGARPPPANEAILRRAQAMPSPATAPAAAPAPSPVIALPDAAWAPSPPPPARPPPVEDLQDDEDLNRALILSLDLNGPPTSSATSIQRPTPTGSLPTGPVAPPAAVAVRPDAARVKELFMLYRAQGVAPNEAASRAAEEARRQ